MLEAKIVVPSRFGQYGSLHYTHPSITSIRRENRCNGEVAALSPSHNRLGISIFATKDLFRPTLPLPLLYGEWFPCTLSKRVLLVPFMFLRDKRISL